MESNSSFNIEPQVQSQLNHLINDWQQDDCSKVSSLELHGSGYSVYKGEYAGHPYKTAFAAAYAATGTYGFYAFAKYIAESAFKFMSSNQNKTHSGIG